MTSVSILRNARAPEVRAHPKTALVDETGARLVLPFAPVGATLGDLGPEWAQAPRDGGRAPLLILAARRLPTLTLAADIADTRNPDASQEGLIFAAVAMANRARRVAITNYGALVGGAWRILNVAVDVTRRQPGTNAATAGVLTIELAKASDAVVRVGAATGGAKAPTAPRVNTVTVRAGETPAALAWRALGDPNRVADLLDANRLRDPRKLTAGRVLVVPS